MSSSPQQPNKNNKRPRPTAAAAARPDEVTPAARTGGTNTFIFANLQEWVRQQQQGGAWVHPAVTMMNDRTLVVTEEIAPGTTLMRLPGVQVPRSKTAATTTSDEEEDAELAWYLLTHRRHRRGAHYSLHAYWNSLPATIDLPRTTWSEHQLVELLTGSPVLQRVREQRDALSAAYQQRLVVRDQRRTTTTTGDEQQSNGSRIPDNDNHNNAMPSLSEFSHALAVVTSRAFASPSGAPVLVPLLDLCNHHRGGNNQKKNLSYTFYPKQRNTRDDPGDDDAAGAWTVVVTAATRIAAHGDPLRITYGARGNAQLLLNYGFCLRGDNQEPDGSSNDALEFFVGDGSNKALFLRTGPKADTYGGFVRALERVMEQSGDRSGVNTNNTAVRPDAEKDLGGDRDGGGGGSVPDDMEEFLDQCDKEEEEEEEDDDDSETGGVVHGDEVDDCDCFPGLLESKEGNDASESTKERELEALSRFRTRLQETAGAYNLQKDGIEDILKSAAAEDASPELYAAILIKSELRTLQFYLHAIEAVETKLGKEQPERTVALVHLERSEMDLMAKQVEELAGAFMQIRHSDLVVS